MEGGGLGEETAGAVGGALHREGFAPSAAKNQLGRLGRIEGVGSWQQGQMWAGRPAGRVWKSP